MTDDSLSASKLLPIFLLSSEPSDFLTKRQNEFEFTMVLLDASDTMPPLEVERTTMNEVDDDDDDDGSKSRIQEEEEKDDDGEEDDEKDFSSSHNELEEEEEETFGDYEEDEPDNEEDDEDEEDEEDSEDEDEDSEDEEDDNGRNNKSDKSDPRKLSILELLSRVESSRQLTSSMLRSGANNSSSVGTSSTIGSSSSLRGSYDDHTNSTMSGSESYSTLREHGEEEDDEEDHAAAAVVRPSTTEDDMDDDDAVTKFNVEALMLRVDTVHRSTRSFLADDVASSTASSRDSSFWESVTPTTTTTTTAHPQNLTTSSSSSSPVVSSSSLLAAALPTTPAPTSSSIDDQIEKTRLELQGLKDQGVSKRQHHQAQFKNATERLESATTSYAQARKSLLLPRQEAFYGHIMKEAVMMMVSNDDDDDDEHNNDDATAPPPANNTTTDDDVVWKMQTKLLIALHITLEIHPRQIDLWQDSILDLDRKNSKEAQRLKRRTRRSRDQWHQDIAKATNRNVVLYDFLALRVKLQRTEIRKYEAQLGQSSTLLLLPTVTEEGEDQDDQEEEQQNKTTNNEKEKGPSSAQRQIKFDSWARSSISQWAQGTQNVMKGLANQMEKSVPFSTTSSSSSSSSS
jgi:hypothetical protein